MNCLLGPAVLHLSLGADTKQLTPHTIIMHCCFRLIVVASSDNRASNLHDDDTAADC